MSGREVRDARCSRHPTSSSLGAAAKHRSSPTWPTWSKLERQDERGSYYERFSSSWGTSVYPNGSSPCPSRSTNPSPSLSDDRCCPALRHGATRTVGVECIRRRRVSEDERALLDVFGPAREGRSLEALPPPRGVLAPSEACAALRGGNRRGPGPGRPPPDRARIRDAPLRARVRIRRGHPPGRGRLRQRRSATVPATVTVG